MSLAKLLCRILWEFPSLRGEGGRSLTEDERLALQHAWAWYERHSEKRMQAFNFFFIAAGLFAAAYASVIDDRPGVAAAVGFFAVAASLMFILLDRRNQDLVHFGDESLKQLERTLRKSVRVPEIEMASRADPWCKSPWQFVRQHSVVIPLMETLVSAAFLSGAIYATFQVA